MAILPILTIEGNLERVLNLLKAMSPIAVIVDEADAHLASSQYISQYDATNVQRRAYILTMGPIGCLLSPGKPSCLEFVHTRARGRLDAKGMVGCPAG
ncbi:MAG: hypothetical protein LAO76_26460 [Acidobacteriia bacterium]|nr:hypothetical protein [Terriglobia bacterium]